MTPRDGSTQRRCVIASRVRTHSFKWIQHAEEIKYDKLRVSLQHSTKQHNCWSNCANESVKLEYYNTVIYLYVCFSNTYNLILLSFLLIVEQISTPDVVSSRQNDFTSRSARQHQEESNKYDQDHRHEKVGMISDLALKELETGTATSADVAQLVFGTVISNDCRSVASTDDDGGALLRCLNCGIEQCLRALGKCGEFEDTRGTTRQTISEIR